MHAVLERVVSQIAKEVGGLDAETTQLHPKDLAYKWSAQQVVEHLVLGYRLTSETLETKLAKRRLSHYRKRTYVQWSLQLMVLTFGNLPQGAPAMEETMPTPGQFAAMDGRQIGDLLRQEIQAMDTLLDACRHMFGMQRVATHPLLGPLRVDQWRRFHVVHGLHHLAQLRSVIEQVTPDPVPLKISGKNLVKEMHVPAQRPLA